MTRFNLIFAFFVYKFILIEATNNTTTIWENVPINTCTVQLLELYQGFLTKDVWALKMLDAWAKPQSGILFGNIMHIGNYDECIEVEDGTNLKGKYCNALLSLNRKNLDNSSIWALDVIFNSTNSDFEGGEFMSEVKQSYGICVPKSCSAKNLQNLSSLLVEYYKLPIDIQFDDTLCDDGEGFPFSTSAIFAILIFALFAAIILFSTLYDLNHTNKANQEKEMNLFTAFSVISNGRKLFSTKSSESSLKCLNGIRVISMMWIVLGHRLLYSFLLPKINAMQMFEWRESIINTMFAGASMAVDTFFTISGLLVVYLHCKNQEKGIKFNIPMFYLHRILRLTPALVMVVLFSATLLHHVGNGPFWFVVEEIFQKPCVDHWWSTLIYLQNYIHTNSQCVGQAWYLAVDTQMYFLSPLILLPLMKWPKATIGSILVFTILNCAYVFEIIYKLDMGFTILDNDVQFFRYVYSPTHVRGTVYLIGMICGYLIFQTRCQPVKLSHTKVIVSWILALSVLISVVLGHSPFLRGIYSIWDASTFNALTRVSWSIGLCIVILLCVNGYGGIINSFLSHSVFTVLIRLNYSVYLLHLLITTALVAQERTPSYFSNMYWLHSFCGDYVFALGAAVVWTLSFESPIIAFEKIIFSRNKK